MQRQDNDIDGVNELTPLKAAFPPVLRLYQLALTLPCSINCVMRALVFTHRESENLHSHIHERDEAVSGY